MADLIQLTQGTLASAGGITLETGEPGYATDTKELLLGDGTTPGGVPVVANAWQALTSGDIAAAGTTTLTMTTLLNRREFLARIVPGAGSGTYTHKIVLPITGRRTGDRCSISLRMPASANPTLAFHTTDGATTALFTVSPDAGVARNYSLEFIFSGSAWELWDQHQIV